MLFLAVFFVQYIQSANLFFKSVSFLLAKYYIIYFRAFVNCTFTTAVEPFYLDLDWEVQKEVTLRGFQDFDSISGCKNR
jgi:hypothetical protein